jgi:hypothetical protein
MTGSAPGLREQVRGILLLYHHPLSATAPTIMEHVNAFERHSQFNVWSANTELASPAFLTTRNVDFEIVLLHYSLFVPSRYRLDDEYLSFLGGTSAYKIAFFQDEHHYCGARFAFLNRFRIDCVWTLLEPDQWPKVYGKYTAVPKLVYTLPGFASDVLSDHAAMRVRPDDARAIDIGYRARDLAPYMGVGALEKADIGRGVLERAAACGLTADISMGERDRIYGDDWFAFLANCKATLGTEAGVSIFDTDDEVRPLYERLVAERPGIARDEILERLRPYENNVYYRTISPRHFEAAALRVCQIMYEGRYASAMQPMVHYIPLAKDFSNWAEVVQRFRDSSLRRELTENAHRDLIESGRFSYRAFVDDFDRELIEAGFRPTKDSAVVGPAGLVEQRRGRVRPATRIQLLIDTPFPGRRALLKLLPLGKLRRAVERRRYRRWEAAMRSRND